MSALGALFDRQPRAASIESPAVPLTSTTLLDWIGGPKSYTGKVVNERSALTLSAFYRGVSLISGVLAALPLNVFERGDETRRPLDDGPTVELLEDPHPDMTAFELRELGFASAAMSGDAYYRKLRDQTQTVKELWWLAPHRVRAGRAVDGTKVYVVDGDTDNPLSDRAILHVPGFGYDGVGGLSLVQLARQGLGLGLAAEEFGSRLFGNGALATGILTTDQRLDTPMAEELKRRWKDGGIGLESAHDIRVLGSGSKYQQLTINPDDAQFLETRRFQVVDIARWLGLPPVLLGESGNASNWGTGIEQQNLMMVQYTFGTWITRFAQRYSKLAREIEPGRRVRVRFGLQGLLRGDSAARAEFYRTLFELGVLSTNDIRALEDMGPVDGGEGRYRPLNLGALGQPDPAADTGPDEPVEPAETAQARALAEIVQKLYLGVDVVLTTEEARQIVRDAGGDLAAVLPPELAPSPAPAPTAPVPATDPTSPAPPVEQPDTTEDPDA